MPVDPCKLAMSNEKTDLLYPVALKTIHSAPLRTAKAY